MNKYHLLLVFISTIYCINTLFSCPCMPSPKDSQPFFEQYDDSSDESTKENNKEETSS